MTDFVSILCVVVVFSLSYLDEQNENDQMWNIDWNDKR